MPDQATALETERARNAIHARQILGAGSGPAPSVAFVCIVRTTFRDTQGLAPIDDGLLVDQTTSGWIASDRDASRALVQGAVSVVHAATALSYSEADDRAVDRLMKSVRARRRSGSRKISRTG